MGTNTIGICQKTELYLIGTYPSLCCSKYGPSVLKRNKLNSSKWEKDEKFEKKMMKMVQKYNLYAVLAHIISLKIK